MATPRALSFASVGRFLILREIFAKVCVRVYFLKEEKILISQYCRQCVAQKEYGTRSTGTYRLAFKDVLIERLKILKQNGIVLSWIYSYRCVVQ